MAQEFMVQEDVAPPPRCQLAFWFQLGSVKAEISPSFNIGCLGLTSCTGVVSFGRGWSGVIEVCP